jgi:hypothetical protein
MFANSVIVNRKSNHIFPEHHPPTPSTPVKPAGSIALQRTSGIRNYLFFMRAQLHQRRSHAIGHLSKAFLRAADTKITDPSITHQLRLA